MNTLRGLSTFRP